MSGESWDEQLLEVAERVEEALKTSDKQRVNDAHIERSVARSEPPRMEDIPAHVKFCRKWGGGQTQAFVRELVEYLRERMPPGRVVPGKVFITLATLPLSADEMVPRFVCACVKLLGTCNEDHGGVASVLKDSDLRTIASTKKDLVLTAEQVMNRARILARSSHDDDQQACIFMYLYTRPSATVCNCFRLSADCRYRE